MKKWSQRSPHCTEENLMPRPVWTGSSSPSTCQLCSYLWLHCSYRSWDCSIFTFHLMCSSAPSVGVFLARVKETCPGCSFIRLWPWKWKACRVFPLTREDQQLQSTPERKKRFSVPTELLSQTYWVQSSNNWGQPIKLMAWSQRCVLGPCPWTHGSLGMIDDTDIIASDQNPEGLKTQEESQDTDFQ